MGWRVVDCTNLQGSVSAVPGAVVIKTGSGDETRFPVKDLAVVLFGVNTRFSAGVIHRLTGEGVSVLLCDWRGVPESAAHPWSDHTRVGARQRAQASVSRPRQKALWAALVRAKVGGQSKVLQARGHRASQQLAVLAKRVRSGDPENIEAQAARLYWNALFPGEDFVRMAGTGFGRNALQETAVGLRLQHGSAFGLRALLAGWNSQPFFGAQTKNGAPSGRRSPRTARH